MSISRRARRFQELLRDRGLDLTVVELPASTRTADDAARALGCAKAQIVKSIVFRVLATDEPVVVLASGPNRIDESAVAEVVGGEIGKADADFVRRTTGYSIGGVPPVGHPQPLRTVVDEDLLAHDEVWAAAGTPNAVVRITGKITDVLPAHTVIRVR
ncbi:MAG: YbaK/EbsC family protein [Actinomycetales bacterium]|nr:YbaK/EbsC family protein [Actinomycetales bacterium]